MFCNVSQWENVSIYETPPFHISFANRTNSAHWRLKTKQNGGPFLNASTHRLPPSLADQAPMIVKSPGRIPMKEFSFALSYCSCFLIFSLCICVCYTFEPSNQTQGVPMAHRYNRDSCAKHKLWRIRLGPKTRHLWDFGDPSATDLIATWISLLSPCYRNQWKYENKSVKPS